jgi:DNA mismatch repair protein MSH6
VVEHLVARVKCISLFATHYHSLVNDWSLDPRVKLGHMDCFVQTEETEETSTAAAAAPPPPSLPPPGEEVTFLYKLCDGSSPRSYGINVARLARLPQEILDVAQQQSAVFEDQLLKKRSLLSDDASMDENLDKKTLYVKIYDRIMSIAESDISSAEMSWLVREIWQRFQHVASGAK